MERGPRSRVGTRRTKSQGASMDTPIILIGPLGVGKTTIAELLAQRLGTVHYELDDRRWEYYGEIGYDHDHAVQLGEKEGFPAVLKYWKPFEVHAVERILADCKDGVISFGAGHSVYEDEALFERAQRALAPYNNVILLLPCEDVDQAAAILNERFIRQMMEEGITPHAEELEIREHFIRHPSNRRLAKRVVYTEGKSPEETCEEIVHIVRDSTAGRDRLIIP